MRVFFQIIYSIGLIFLKAFVLLQLWEWYITPFFPNFPQLTFFISVGVVIMANVLMYLPVWNHKDYKAEFKYNITIGAKPIVLLALGWIVHLFM